MDVETNPIGGFWARVKQGARDTVDALRSHPLAVAALGGCGVAQMMGLGVAVSAESLIEVGDISDTLTAIGSTLFVGILNMVVGAWPVLILLGIILFCNRFLGKILDMFDILR